MNARHTFALLLIAGGAFLILVGAIFGGVGLATLAESEDRIPTEVSAAFAVAGGLVLTSGMLALVFGIRVYRRSDHRLQVVRDRLGRVVGRRFPILAPMMVVLFVILTIGLAWPVAEYGLDLTNPTAVRVYVTWGILAILLFSAAAAAGYRRLRGAGAAPEGSSSLGGEGAGPVQRVNPEAGKAQRG